MILNPPIIVNEIVLVLFLKQLLEAVRLYNEYAI